MPCTLYNIGIACCTHLSAQSTASLQCRYNIAALSVKLHLYIHSFIAKKSLNWITLEQYYYHLVHEPETQFQQSSDYIMLAGWIELNQDASVISL